MDRQIGLGKLFVSNFFCILRYLLLRIATHSLPKCARNSGRTAEPVGRSSFQVLVVFGMISRPRKYRIVAARGRACKLIHVLYGKWFLYPEQMLPRLAFVTFFWYTTPRLCACIFSIESYVELLIKPSKLRT